MKILTTGNPNYGLAKSINNLIGGDFISRTNGFDLCDEENQIVAAKKSIKYDIFINNSALWKFNQTLLLEKVWQEWNDNKHSGHIINIGSTADIIVKATNWRYPIEKKSLKAQSRNLAMLGIWNQTNIRVSYVAFGSLDTPKVIEKFPERTVITCDEAAQIIKWIIDSPQQFNINELSLDAIQK